MLSTRTGVHMIGTAAEASAHATEGQRKTNGLGVCMRDASLYSTMKHNLRTKSPKLSGEQKLLIEHLR